MIRNTAYAFIYTVIFIAGMVVINYTIPKNPQAFTNTLSELNEAQEHAPPIVSASAREPSIEMHA